MSKSLNIQLTRQEMQDRAVALNIFEGLDDLKHARFFSGSILDFKEDLDRGARYIAENHASLRRRPARPKKRTKNV